MTQVLVINTYFENGQALYEAGKVYEADRIIQRMVRRGDARPLPKQVETVVQPTVQAQEAPAPDAPAADAPAEPADVPATSAQPRGRRKNT